MDFLRNILAVHLIQDIFERGNVIVIPKGVDTVIHGDIVDTVSSLWKQTAVHKTPGQGQHTGRVVSLWGW